MADVWYVGVDQVPESLAVLLDERDRARCREIAVAADRARAHAAWVLTRLVLGERLGRDPAALRFDRTCAHCNDRTHGKPTVETQGPRPDFSLSHSGGLAVLVVSDRVVGVDVEDVTARERPLAPVLSARERVNCRSYADFARLWTRKEALLKAVGKGLAVHPRHVEVLGTTLLGLPAELGSPGDYTLQDLPLPAPYVGSVAVLGPQPTLSVRNGQRLVGRAGEVCEGRSSRHGTPDRNKQPPSDREQPQYREHARENCEPSCRLPRPEIPRAHVRA